MGVWPAKGKLAAGVVRGWTVALVTVSLLAACGGGEETPQARPSPDADLLFVQTAKSGHFGDGEVTLEGVSSVTTWFTDRPARDASAMPTGDFVADFASFFGDEPPNGTISSLDQGVGEFVVELSNPSYDADEETLTYQVVPIGADPADLPEDLGPVSVFIDSSLPPPESGPSGEATRPCAGLIVNNSSQALSSYGAYSVIPGGAPGPVPGNIAAGAQAQFSWSKPSGVNQIQGGEIDYYLVSNIQQEVDLKFTCFWNSDGSLQLSGVSCFVLTEVPVTCSGLVNSNQMIFTIDDR